jgi:hypothetical protein
MLPGSIPCTSLSTTRTEQLAGICVASHAASASLPLTLTLLRSITVQVHPDCSQIQRSLLFDVRRTVVRMGLFSLDAVSKTVDEQSHKVFGGLAAYTKVGRHIRGLLS